MRLEKVNNITGETLRKDSTIKMWRGTFDREYRVTFRDSLTASEKIAKGKWSGKVDASVKYLFHWIKILQRTTASK
jgi:putative ABC transport system permease protein